MARPRLGRGRRLSGRESRAPPAPTRSACSTTAPRIAASARRRSSTSAAKPPRRASEAFKYDRRCDRLAADEVAAPRRRGRCRSSSASACPTARRRGTISSTSTITFPNKDIEDFIILRSDGTPIYNLAVVSDDIAMGITLVMRGDDHISNTPKQILLYRALGATLPLFAHLPMIHGLDGKKLSKRHGATAVGDYQHQASCRGAMLNFLALLGWSPGDDIEVMTVPRDDRAVLARRTVRRRRRSSTRRSSSG